MSVSRSALSSAQNAIQVYSRMVDRAAERIAGWGLEQVSDPGSAAQSPLDGPATAGSGTAGVDLGEAMVSMMIAQRAFSAQLQVIRTSDEMLHDTVSLRGSGSGKG